MKSKIKETPIWNTFERMNDGKYHSPDCKVLWPGYIENKEHPFLYCNSLVHEENNQRTNLWCATDGPEEYKANLKKAPIDWHYRQKKITYLTNNSGYRTLDWNVIDWKNSIVLFGDSCLFGVGVAEDETVSYYLSTMTKRPVINLGYPGLSNEAILDMTCLLLKNFGVPYAVGILWSTTDRFRYFMKNSYVDIGPWVSSSKSLLSDGVDLKGLWANTFYDPSNELVRAYNLGIRAESIWNDKCKYATGSFYSISAHYTRSNFHVILDGTARDMLHPGVSSNIAAAKKFTEYFNE